MEEEVGVGERGGEEEKEGTAVPAGEMCVTCSTQIFTSWSFIESALIPVLDPVTSTIWSMLKWNVIHVGCPCITMFVD